MLVHLVRKYRDKKDTKNLPLLCNCTNVLENFINGIFAFIVSILLCSIYEPLRRIQNPIDESSLLILDARDQ
jgi:hypothetical protein